VKVRGFKSISFCDVTLEPLTLLVGRNASGKSNFLGSLSFFRDLLALGADAAVLQHGGETVFSRLNADRRIAYEIEAEFPSYQTTCRASYQVELIPTGPKQAEISRERLDLTDDSRRLRCGFSAVRGIVTWNGLEEFAEAYTRGIASGCSYGTSIRPNYPSIFDHYRPARPLLAVIGNQPFIDLSGRLQTIECYGFHPDTMRQLQMSFGSPVLERDGRNLARAIEGLREIDEDGVARVGAYLREIVDDVESFDVVRLGDYETIGFELRAPPGHAPLRLNAANMSDGTLRVLASLVAA